MANGHEYVDLGLPSGTLWATCNIGAYSPSDFGAYFQWGHTMPAALEKEFSVQVKDLTYISGNAEYDAATAAWRGPWRMPTREDWEELLRCCRWYSVSQSSHEGLYAAGPSGKAVFFPGLGRDVFTPAGEDVRDVTSEINMTNGMATRKGVAPDEYMLKYWSSSADQSEDFSAYCFTGNVSSEVLTSMDRELMWAVLPIRPVLDGSVVYDPGFVSEEMTEEEKYPYAKAFANRPDGSRAGHGYVDLGLPSGTMWATCNIGSDAPSVPGNFYAWGEDEVKRNYFLEDDSKVFGLIYDDISGSDEFDAARRLWGDRWRVPSEYEMRELVDQCNWTWSRVEGQDGYIVEGKSGNCIFIPAAGCRNGRKNPGVGTDGYLWTSSTWNYFPWPGRPSGNRSTCLSFSSTGSGPLEIRESEREIGMSIRPVFTPEGREELADGEEVTINTEPQGAYVIVDNQHMGTSPFVVRGLKHGKHTIFVYKPEYAPYYSSFHVNPKDKTPVKQVLFSEFLQQHDPKNVITVCGQPDHAQVYIDGRLEAYTPCSIKAVSSGNHLVSIYKEGYEPLNVYVNMYHQEVVVDDDLQELEDDGDGFVDLGLPSGTLWAAKNDEAKEMRDYGRAVCAKDVLAYVSDGRLDDVHLALRNHRVSIDCLPSLSQWEELKRVCKWRLVFIGEDAGYVVEGPNGRAIFLPLCPRYLTSNVEILSSDGAGGHMSGAVSSNVIIHSRTSGPPTIDKDRFTFWFYQLRISDEDKDHYYLRAVLNPSK